MANLNYITQSKRITAVFHNDQLVGEILMMTRAGTRYAFIAHLPGLATSKLFESIDSVKLHLENQLR